MEPGSPDMADPPPTGTPVTKTYQQGVAGYSGNKSVGISTYGGLGSVGQYNANGMTFADGLNDWCTGTDIPPNPYSEVWLLRFDNLGIPAGAKVQSASLTVYAYGNDQNSTLFLSGQYLAAPWNADVPTSCAGCSNAPIGWRYRDGSASPWAGLGASGASDVRSGVSFRLPEAGFVALGSAPMAYTTPLAKEAVQAWVDGQNHGLRILPGVDRVHMGYVQPQRDITGSRPASMHPLLSITYIP